MKQEDYSKTDDCQTESVQADFENLTGKIMHGFIISYKKSCKQKLRLFGGIYN